MWLKKLKAVKVEITKEMVAEWNEFPVTKFLKKTLEERIEDYSDLSSVRGDSCQEMGEVALQFKTRIAAYNDILIFIEEGEAENAEI